MGNQRGGIYLCVPPTEMLGGRVPPVPIIAAPDSGGRAILRFFAPQRRPVWVEFGMLLALLLLNKVSAGSRSVLLMLQH